MNNPRHHHSFFWPILLVGIGVVWLLVNLGIIAPFNIGTILQLWPLLLVVLGLDILFGRRFAWVGSLFGALAVCGVIAFLVMAPSLGIQTSAQARVENFSAPLNQATSVTYNFETASEPVELYALSDSTNLINANIGHQGTMSFQVDQTSNKAIVQLSETFDSSNWFNWNLSFDQLKWKIGLNPTVPADIKLDGGSGSINADLSGVQLQSLTADLGSGSSNFSLPQMNTPMDAEINSGSGSVNISLPSETNLTLRLQSGSGSVNIDLPANSAVRVEVMDSGSGSLSLPSSFTRSTGDIETGSWESSDYAQATTRILIQILDRGSGSISIN